ncbi:MAG TPA: TIGR03032 family protein [bacterium]
MASEPNTPTQSTPPAQGQASQPAQPGQPGQPGQEQAKFELTGSRQAFGWLASTNASIAFTTYQAGKIFFIGLQPDGKVSIFERTLSRCMGLCVEGNSLYVSTLYQLWRFENVLEPGQKHDGYDRLYLPQLGYVTGDLDIHDVAIDSNGKLVFVNTLFGCLATVSETHSFVPVWRPPFISRLAAEDRCHLNGLAMDKGKPAYVTAVSESDVVDGWRDHRRGGGVVVSVQENEIVLRDLSMPHSPRVYRDKLWLHNSGTGYFGYADLKAGKFEPVAFCPGYLRGMSFIGDYAVVGLSKPRKDKTFTGLALDDNLAKYKAEARCGIYVIDLKSGDVVHWIRLEGVVQELYDVVMVPGARRPMAIGFVSDEIRRMITVGKPA